MYREFVSLLSSTCGAPCNVRDLTNYICIALAIPLHLFFSQWLNSLTGKMSDNLGVLQHGYQYCNMPHVGSAGFATYPLPPLNMDLQYVEIVQRHHKRTPYASNTFPHEDISWSCDDIKLVSYGIPDGTDVASVYVSY